MFEDLRFARSNSAVAIAGSAESPAAARAAIPEVASANTGYLQTRFDAATLAAAELLRRVGHGDIAEMGTLLAQAVPPVAASVMLAAGPEPTGRVVTTAGRPAGRRENCSGRPGSVLSLGRAPPAPEPVSGAANR